MSEHESVRVPSVSGRKDLFRLLCYPGDKNKHNMQQTEAMYASDQAFLQVENKNTGKTKGKGSIPLSNDCWRIVGLARESLLCLKMFAFMFSKFSPEFSL